MLTNDQIEDLREAFEQLADPITAYIIKDVARRVEQAGQFTSTAAYQIWRAQELGKSRDQIEKSVAAILNKTIPEVRELFKQAAEVGYNFDIDRLPREAVPFEENTSVQQITAAAVALAEDNLRNITQTLGFQTADGVVHPMLTAYQKTTDYAFTQIITGAADYNTAIRQACKKLAAGGVRVIDYKSGIHTSLEAAIRRNMMGGLGLMVEKISQKNHDQLGADGWEISAHANSAPDHEPIQGKQYSDEEYERLNSYLVRRIGTLNCGHNASPIVLGVSRPQYTAEELERFRKDNDDGVTIEGRHYSGYQATQKQRQLERAIRKQKRQILINEAGNVDKDTLTADRIRLQQLKKKYKEFSSAADLRPQEERNWTAGFGKSQAKRASDAYKKAKKERLRREENLRFIRDDAKIKAKSGLPAKIQEENARIAHTVNVELPKIKGVVPKKAEAVDVYTMAGSGTSTPIRDLKRLYDTYPEYGDAKGWKKKSGTVYAKHHHYVVHWYENKNGVPPNEIKLKGAK